MNKDFSRQEEKQRREQEEKDRLAAKSSSSKDGNGNNTPTNGGSRPSTAPQDSATANMEKNHSALFENAIPRAEDVNELMDRFRTTSVRSKEIAALISEICLPGAVDLILPDPHRFIASRILSYQSIYLAE